MGAVFPTRRRGSVDVDMLTVLELSPAMGAKYTIGTRKYSNSKNITINNPNIIAIILKHV